MIRTWLDNLRSGFLRTGKHLAKRPLGAFFVLLLLGIPATVSAAELSAGDGIANSMLSMVSEALFGLANLVMRLTVYFLQFFLELAAYNDYITSPPVIVGWFMVRDVANMFFIVVLLVIAFATVLGIEQYEWKKTLGKLIIAAVLINFSKLILQLVIDIANIFTVTFLNAVRATAAGNLINMFNFDTMLQIRDNANLSGTSDFRGDIFVAAVLALVLSLMAAFVIGAYTITLLARVVVLWVLIILSPLAFLLQAVPSAKKYADEFWSEFTKHVMVAPLMTFFLWLTFATLGNGDITSSIGINTSAVGRAGADAPQIAGVDAQPAIALSQAGTWESLSNFIISIGFLVVGIMAVQRLNVQAGGIAGGAVDFGKKVATIASGYAAGRFLVGAAGDIGLDAAGDYGKILASRAKKIPYLGAPIRKLQESGIRRKAAVARQQALDDARAREIKAEGGGLAGRLISSAQDRVGAELKAEAAQKKSDLQGEQVMQDIREKHAQAFNEDYESVMKIKIDAAKAAAEANGEDVDEIAKKTAKDGLTRAEQQELLNRHALVNLGSLSRDVEVAKQKSDGLLGRAIGELNLGKLIEDRNTFNSRLDGEKATMLEERVQKEGFESVEKYLESKVEGVADADERTRKKEEARQDLVSKLTPNEIASAELRAAQGLAVFDAIEAKGRAQQKEKKLESEFNRLTRVAGDILRGEEAKEKKLVLEWETSEAKADMEEYARFGFNELFAKIVQNHQLIKTLEAIPKENRTEDETKQLKNVKQEQMRAVSSAIHRGWGAGLGKSIAAVDDSYRDKDLNTPESMHKVLLGLTTARSFNEFDSPEVAAAHQEQLRKELKEKGDVLFRTLKIASDHAADEKHQRQFYNLLSEGVTEFGDKRVGYTDAMRANAGQGNILGTMDKNAGTQKRKEAIEGELNPNVTFQTVSDPRAIVKIQVDAEGNEKVVGLIDDHAKEMVASILDMTAQQIQKDDTPKYNMISGGGYDKSSWNESRGQFVAGAMAETMEDILEGLFNKIDKSKTETVKNKYREQAKAVLKQFGVSDKYIKDKVDKAGKQIESLLNDISAVEK